MDSVLGFGRAAIVATLVHALLCGARLPVRVYTTADGLPGNTLHAIVPDRRGFLWFCTGEGLALFDGRRFRTFGPEDGLPHPEALHFLHARDGKIWVGTKGGVALLRPLNPARPADRFEVFRPEGSTAARVVNAILDEPDGSLWCGTRGGLYRLKFEKGKGVFERVEMGSPVRKGLPVEIAALVRDLQGNLWVAARDGLYRRDSSGATDRWTSRQGLPTDKSGAVTALMLDRAGRLWVGGGRGLARLVENPAADHNVVERKWRVNDGLPGAWVQSLAQLSDGSVWAGGLDGLARLEPGAGPKAHFQTFGVANGLSDANIEALAEDREGNIWAGSARGGGVMRISKTGFRTFGAADGLRSNDVVSILETRRGQLCVVTLLADHLAVHCYNGLRFETRAVNPASSAQLAGRSAGQEVLRDSRGGWWFPSTGGFLYFTGGVSPSSPRTLVAGDSIGSPGFRVFADNRGDIWMSFSSWKRNVLARWDSRRGKLRTFSEDDGLPPLDSSLPWVFAEDRRGNIWVGLADAGLVRYRQGRFERIPGPGGDPEGRIRALYCDHAGRMWAAWALRGTVRWDKPAADRPQVSRIYSKRDGLASDNIYSIVEDLAGQIYVGSEAGVDRFDPEQPAGAVTVEHFSRNSGLADGVVQCAFRDRSGRLWFGSSNGLSCYDPAPVRVTQPARAWITGIIAGDQPWPVAELGETDVGGISLSRGRNRLRIEFAAPSYAGEGSVAYQYKLEGADRDWTTSHRNEVDYANLAVGQYRFRVRSASADGVVTPAASVSFEVLPPFWRRWWFMLLCAGAIAALTLSIHRRRVARLVELERIRTHIASDLHDEIGSGLSRIALLTEVARQRLGNGGSAASASLARIGEISRELAESMTDIVWAVDPARDDLQELVQRVRSIAGETLEARSIVLDFHGPSPDTNIMVNAGTRRQLLLVFKEAIHNISRHSSCRHARIQIALEGGVLRAEISDDGCGFDAQAQSAGRGLANIKDRIRQLAGQVEIRSTPEGTLIRFWAPVTNDLFR